MGCHRCGTRQTDPARGASPWRRGVVDDRQVLVCPECLRDPASADALDRCAGCGSTALVRQLGETRCRACGRTGPGLAGPARRRTSDGALRRRALADEVAAALDRVLGRGPDAPPAGR